MTRTLNLKLVALLCVVLMAGAVRYHTDESLTNSKSALGSRLEAKHSKSKAVLGIQSTQTTNTTNSTGGNEMDEIITLVLENTDDTVTIPVSGPKVNGAIKKQFYYAAGKGNYAFDRNREWDRISIFDTRVWPNLCKYSLSQSPIHLDLTQPFMIEPHKLVFDYVSSTDDSYTLSNDGYKIVVNGTFGQLKWGAHIFDAYSMQLHHPSEHTVGPDMTRADFELQILHYDAFGLKTIVAVLFDRNQNQTDEDSDFLTSIGLAGSDTVALSSGTTRTITGLDLAAVVEGAEHFISYEGSITTPPCTDGVKWFILNKKNPCSSSQVQSFYTLFGSTTNVRGIQPQNGRKLSLF